MKSDVRVWDPQKRPICPIVDESDVIWETLPPSRFRRKKRVTRETASLYNENIKTMPEDI